jgi:flagellar protein FliO/FliZ
VAPPSDTGTAAATTGPASAGQLQQPSRKSEGSAVESQPIRRDRPPRDGSDAKEDGAGAARRDGVGKPVAPPQPAGFGLGNVALSLGAVLGLILVVYWLIRQIFPGVAAARSSQAVRVLSRSVLAPRQQVLLLQVGRRVIVVGDSGAQMSPLAQIEDPDEIAALVGQIESEKRPAASAFGGFFGRAKAPFDSLESDPKPAIDDRAEPTDDEADAAQEQPPAELGLSTAQGELKGLMDRVKELSQNFRRS